MIYHIAYGPVSAWQVCYVAGQENKRSLAPNYTQYLSQPCRAGRCEPLTVGV